LGEFPKKPLIKNDFRDWVNSQKTSNEKTISDFRFWVNSQKTSDEKVFGFRISNEKRLLDFGVWVNSAKKL